MGGKKGSIEEVSTDGECRQYCATVGPRGFESDRSGTPGIVILNAEVPHYINTEFGEQLQVMAGQLGDNLLVRGLGDMTDLVPGTIIRIKQIVLLRVESKAIHYREMFKRFPKEVLALLDKRGGSTCSVVEGIGERVCDEDEIEILHEEDILRGAA